MWKTLFFLQGNVTCLAVGLIGGCIAGVVIGIGMYDDRSKRKPSRVSYKSFMSNEFYKKGDA